VRVLIPLFLLTVLLFSCTPRGGTKVQIPPTLRADNIPKPFVGKILLGTDGGIPFKYYPKGDRVVFPLLYAGFIYYKNRTLGFGSRKLTLPLELWRILKHRLVFPNYTVLKTNSGYEIDSSKGNVRVELYTDRFLRPLKAEICDQSGCFDVSYRGSLVDIKAYGVDIYFYVPKGAQEQRQPQRGG